ncbi:hypothetical protein GCM10027605_52410 [Micromonospora zhanjiangensis]
MTITDDYLPVPVPESLTATYLVPTSGEPPLTPAEAVAALGDRLAAPVRDLATQMIDSPLLTVDTRPVVDFPHLPPDLLAAFGATGNNWPGSPRPVTWSWSTPVTGPAGRRHTSGPPGRSRRRWPSRWTPT